MPISIHESSLPANPPLPLDSILERLALMIAERKNADPNVSYVAKLWQKGLDTILKKVGEESTELVIAAKDGMPDKLIYETADLWFHSLIALAYFGLGPQQVLAELARREGLSGLTEFAARQSDPL